MSTPAAPQDSSSITPGPRFLAFRIARLVVGLALGVGLLAWFCSEFWKSFSQYREASEASRDSAPVGYVGVSLRRTYNDRPPVFFASDGGRRRLWAAKGPDGQPEFYDVTDARFDVDKVSGGFGRDSIPGIDYPLLKPAGMPETRRLRDAQPVLGLMLGDGPRAYPLELLRKIEVVNDQDGVKPFLIVYDREAEEARFYDRLLDGHPITYGTTGYAIGASSDPNKGRPVLYDRKTRSLWLPEKEALACVNGSLQGTRLPVTYRAEPTPCAEWTQSHPQTSYLMGNDRDNDLKPIPTE